MEDDGPLIPVPSTDLDRRVNAAFQRARRRGKMQHVWVAGEGNDAPIVITDRRPPTVNCIAVSPDRWAVWVAAGAPVPWQEPEEE